MKKIYSAKDSKESSGPKMSVVPRLRNPSSNCIHLKVDSISSDLKITQLCPSTTDSSLPPLTDWSCLTDLGGIVIFPSPPAFPSCLIPSLHLCNTHICIIPSDLMSQGLCEFPLLEWPPFQSLY